MIVEQWFSFFMIYSVIGWVYESILCSVVNKKYINRGFLNGPYCPIYGMGAVFILLLLGELNNPIHLFILGTLLTCTLEYITSIFMENFFQAKLWDYSKRKCNINGRVCLLGAAVFGLFSVVLVLYLHPLVLNVIESIPNIMSRIMYSVIACIFTFDNIVTISGYYGVGKMLES